MAGVKIVDANVLLYAVNEDTPEHDASRTWLDGALSGSARVGFAWLALVAFARLSSHPSVLPTPLAVTDALTRVGQWMSAASAQIVSPTARHPEIVASLLAPIGHGGNIVNDAHLAALAVEHRSEVVSYDRDFGRFPGVVWQTPDQLLGPTR